MEGLGIPTDTENQEYCSPVLKSCVFHLVKKETWITFMHSDAFDALTLELAEELFGETEADYGSDVFGDEQFALIVEEDSHNKNSQLLGHPYSHKRMFAKRVYATTHCSSNWTAKQ